MGAVEDVGEGAEVGRGRRGPAIKARAAYGVAVVATDAVISGEGGGGGGEACDDFVHEIAICAWREKGSEACFWCK